MQSHMESKYFICFPNKVFLWQNTKRSVLSNQNTSFSTILFFQILSSNNLFGFFFLLLLHVFYFILFYWAPETCDHFRSLKLFEKWNWHMPVVLNRLFTVCMYWITAMTALSPNNLMAWHSSCPCNDSHLETNQQHVLCQKTILFRDLPSLCALLVCIWYMLQCLQRWQLWTSVIVLDRVEESCFSWWRSTLRWLCQSCGSTQPGWDGSASHTVRIKWLFCNGLSGFHFLGDRTHLQDWERLSCWWEVILGGKVVQQKGEFCSLKSLDFKAQSKTR